MIEFTATTIVVDDTDDDFILIGFADECDGEYRDAVHFQRAYVFDEQDIALGMNDVYVERGIQAGSGYGGIDKVVLERNFVQLAVSGRTAESLGDTDFKINFSIADTQFYQLQRGLRIVFDGFQSLHEGTA